MEKKKYFISLALIFIVGALDAYSYLLHGGMFASMQTGNMIKIAIKLAYGDFQGLGSYFLTIFAFAVGIVVAQLLVKLKHFQTVCVSIALGCYIIGIAIPLGELNWLANLIMAFGVGVQLQAVRSIWGFPVATTMCTGNLRSMSECVAALVTTREKKNWLGIFLYSSLIITFTVGVLVGGIIIRTFF